MINLASSEMSSPYKVEKNNEAFIKETLFEAYLYRRQWTVIHFIELQDLLKQGTDIQYKLDKLKIICKNSHCTKGTSLQLLSKRFNSTLEIQEGLLDFHLRKKRDYGALSRIAI